MQQNRTLIQGENLTEMREFPDDYVDLIASNPPSDLVTQCEYCHAE